MSYAEKYKMSKRTFIYHSVAAASNCIIAALYFELSNTPWFALGHAILHIFSMCSAGFSYDKMIKAKRWRVFDDFLK